MLNPVVQLLNQVLGFQRNQTLKILSKYLPVGQ